MSRALSKPRLLYVHPGLCPPGGGEGLAACLLQGLVDTGDYQIAMASLRRPDLAGLNKFFGTSLRDEDFEIVTAPPWLDRAVHSLPTPAALLEMSILEFFVRRLAKRVPVDLFFSTCNEQGFPRPGLQYIHYPKYHLRRGEGDYHWYHRVPGVLRAYRAFCRALVDFDAVARNRTLANSRYTAAAFREVHECPVHVVYPPVPGEPPALVPWDRRANRIVCLGRIAGEKKIPLVIDIVRRVREQVPGAQAPELEIVGSWNCDHRLRGEIELLLERHAGWLHLRLDLSREELDRLLAASRYGLHGMPDEHFGMAVAEMQRAGCIAFVPATGGPLEIVGDDASRQIYASPDEAVEKIVAVLADPAIQETLHRRALGRASIFTTTGFVKECLHHIEEALGEGRAAAGE